MFDLLPAPAVIAVDLQTRLMPVIHEGNKVLERACMFLQGVRTIGLPVMATEQYPKGLGPSVPEIAEIIPEADRTAKISFSVFGAPEIREHLAALKAESLIFCGVETHVCVLQSILDALHEGFQAVLAVDAAGSRTEMDKDLALAEIRRAGGRVLSAEALLFMLMRDAKHPAFKSVSKLVK